MTELLMMLRERAEEFDIHHALAVSLEDQIFGEEDVSIGSTRLSVENLLTMKSSLIVHLYNVLESVMSQATKIVGNAFGTVPPKTWSEKARREWLREHGVARIEGDAAARLKKIQTFSTKILADSPLGPQEIRKPTGTWTDESIRTFAERLGVQLQIEPDLYRRLAKKDDLGEKGPLQFLAYRRNALAHGQTTFLDGGRDLTLAQIREIADVTLEFMELVATSFQTYVDQKHFVAAA
ncbi:MAG: hypothetical protein IM671_10410 [Phenylobacterium sp.]|uniref:MAE_28990/MAE_18760 family HEPN-like nuclease n=1 Tax=Phenylobacterium sp. TaxID=1871053 RepID=UPI0025EEDED7|nr:MAE_28990/MAE_18760 family HEPN-like nuclease [Phenylobacterium sp.]MCA6247121.1 hypothetical protein [Phenylobacterium sp.]